MPHALIVDDSAATLSALVELVSAEGFTTSAALTVDRAKVELSRQSPDIVLADLNLPDGTGMNLLDAVERSGASPAVVFITGQASVDTAVEALRRGVTDYLTKPLDVNRLREILGDVSRTGHIGEEIVELKAKQRGTGRFAGIVGRSEPILKLGELIGAHRAEQRQRPGVGRERLGQGSRGAHHPRVEPAPARAVRRRSTAARSRPR